MMPEPEDADFCEAPFGNITGRPERRPGARLRRDGRPSTSRSGRSTLCASSLATALDSRPSRRRRRADRGGIHRGGRGGRRRRRRVSTACDVRVEALMVSDRASATEPYFVERIAQADARRAGRRLAAARARGVARQPRRRRARRGARRWSRSASVATVLGDVDDRPARRCTDDGPRLSARRRARARPSSDEQIARTRSLLEAGVDARRGRARAASCAARRGRVARSWRRRRRDPGPRPVARSRTRLIVTDSMTTSLARLARRGARRR